MKLTTLLFVALLNVAFAASDAPRVAEWHVRDSTSMAVPRAAHQATLIGPNEVLLTGGCSGPRCSPAERSAEVYDADTGRSTPTKPMHEQRVAHVAARLSDGRVLVAGGWTGVATTSSAEVFDVQRGVFMPVGAMAVPRMDATATAMADGSILVVGGASATNQPVARSERFAAPELAFRPAAALLEARVHHAAVRLPDDRVLVLGGMRAGKAASRTAEIYDPKRDRFEFAGSMLQARCKHAAVLLKDGRVLVIGGSTDCDDRNRIAATEFYDPGTGLFSQGPPLLNPRYKIASAATVLPGGEVVIAGDADDVEIWAPGDRRFSRISGGVGQRLAFSAAVTLQDGRVLVTGGYNDETRVLKGAWQVSRRLPVDQRK
jgi:hypothetical protein